MKISNINIPINKKKEEVRILIKLFFFDHDKYAVKLISHDLLKIIEIEYNITDYRILKDQLEDAFINVIQDISVRGFELFISLI